MMKNENPSDHGKHRQQTIEVVKRNWRAEVETAQVYRDLAERERDEKRKGILLRMAEAEERHAQRWELKLRDLGVEPPVLRDTIGRRLNRWWNKIAGVEIAIRRMESAQCLGSSPVSPAQQTISSISFSSLASPE